MAELIVRDPSALTDAQRSLNRSEATSPNKRFDFILVCERDFSEKTKADSKWIRSGVEGPLSADSVEKSG